VQVQLTEQQKIQVREDFARRRRNQLIATGPAILAAVSLGVASSAGVPAAGAVQGVAAALIIGAVGYALRNWRCPACDGYLGRAMNPKFCAKCGAQLR
jgi:rRNA maturation endonuclease Nob1